MTQLVSTLPYAQRFPARVAEGTTANLPAAPEGLGDLYYASDTLTIYTSNAAGDGWVATPTAPSTRKLSDVQDAAPNNGDVLTWVNANNRYEPVQPGASAFTGVVVTKNAGGTTTLASTTTTISWDAEPIDTDGFFIAAVPRTTITVPAGLAGIYRLSFTINLVNNAGSVWSGGDLIYNVNATNDAVFYHTDIQEDTISINIIRTLAASDDIQWLVTNDSGGTRKIGYVEFSMQLLELS